MKVYKTVNRHKLTYGCESWTLIARQKSKFEATKMRYPGRVKRITRRDRLRNDIIIIRTGLKTNSIQDLIEQRQLSLWRHLQRMKKDVPVKQV